MSVKTLNGIWRIIPSMALTEIIGQSGFDFQILDCEHGAYDFTSLSDDIKICHLCSNKAFIRVSGLNKVEVQRCLDLGADGIVFPQLESYNDFKQAVNLMHYAPNGSRGFNPFVRSADYGVNTREKDPPKCIVIIETLQAVQQIDQILSINGIDMIYIGVYDLSAQLNLIGQMDAPELITTIDTIIKACLTHQISASVMALTPEQQTAFKDKGIDVIVHGVESFLLKKMFNTIINF